jgi:hypothetical protein
MLEYFESLEEILEFTVMNIKCVAVCVITTLHCYKWLLTSRSSKMLNFSSTHKVTLVVSVMQRISYSLL